MRVLCQFENFSREASQLRSMIEDLKRGVLVLDTNIAAVVEFERQADPIKSAYPIAARTLKARRDNLVRTIAILERKLNEVEAILRQSATESGLRDQAELVHNE